MQLPCRFGKYLLLERIASGGMAEVFRARVSGAENFQRLVAIKRILPHLLQDAQFTRMFIDEAKLASQLNHSNIVHIYELGKHHGQLYISMELVHGRDLRHTIKKAVAAQHTLPPLFAAYVVHKAAEGLDFAHKKTSSQGTPLNLVHRDVSPQNILISYDGEVKVADFGIAKATERTSETQAGFLKGKFGYVSPEQAKGENIDHRSDIYGLGICLYEALAGKKLFTADSELAILELVKQGTLPDFKQTLPHLSEAFHTILEKALQADPQLRYQHASELAEDLQTLLIDASQHVFSGKQASQVMQNLYQAEIKDLHMRLATFSQLNDDAISEETSSEEHDPIQTHTFDTEKSRVTSFTRRAKIVPLAQPRLSFIDKLLTPPRSYAVLAGLFMITLGTAAWLLRPTTPNTIPAALSPPRMSPAPQTPTPVETAPSPTLPPKRTQAPRQKYGYVTIKALGATNTVIWIDNKKIGHSPVVQLKLRTGKHTLVAKEEIDGVTSYRHKEMDFTLKPEHTQKDALKLWVQLAP
jgi:serine/threonine protein kinase